MLSPDWILDPKISSLIRHKARRLARSGGFSRSDQADIEQELAIHLMSKSGSFDPNRAQAATFASRLIENRARSMHRAALMQKRDARRCVSLNAPTFNKRGKATTLAECVDASVGRRHTGQRVRSELDARQLKFDVTEATKDLDSSLRDMAALLSHVSPFAAAEVMGISRRQAAEYVGALRESYLERGLVA
jgi:DNA-directed RNA polymerase specialized sigma24 family protein